MSKKVLEMKDISIGFNGVSVLKDVNLDLYEGEVNILLGENGAGKSTLMKILVGAYHKDSGQIFLKGQPVEINSTTDSEKLGISMIYQEFNLIPNLSVAENIFLGRELTNGPLKKIDYEEMIRQSQSVLNRLHVKINPRTKVKDLGIAQQQMVEIAKAMLIDSRILIMDEPTAALTNDEIETLFTIIKQMKSSGISIIYISHRLEEFKFIGDRVTTLRDGHTVGITPISEATQDKLIELMVGRDITDQFPKIKIPIGDEVLRVEGLTNDVIKDVNLVVHKGEILGISGLVGAGRTETVRAIFGADSKIAGKIYVDGSEVHINKPEDAINHQIGFVTENRRDEGLVLSMDVRDNITLPSLKKLESNPLKLNFHREKEVGQSYMKSLAIKASSDRQKSGTLSGGNQQKIVIAKWLETHPKVLIMDEPTRGIDVGAKYEIYQIMNQLKKKGVGIIMISSELPEILGMSDQIVVMYEGRVTGTFANNEDITQEYVMQYATGGKK